jgi:hypothetical protein
MRYGLSLVTTLAWALWLGGLMALFFFVSHLFKVDRSTAIIAAPQIFAFFERYQLILAAIALLSVFVWRVKETRLLLSAIFACFALAAVGAVIVAAVITPPMERLRLAGESGGPEFRQLHGRAMMTFVAETALLLGAGIILPVAIRPATMHPARRTEPAPDPR